MRTLSLVVASALFAAAGVPLVASGFERGPELTAAGLFALAGLVAGTVGTGRRGILQLVVAGALWTAAGFCATAGVAAADNVFGAYKDNTDAAYLTIGGAGLAMALLLAAGAGRLLLRPLSPPGSRA